jgi:hypothetical protein
MIIEDIKPYSGVINQNIYQCRGVIMVNINSFLAYITTYLTEAFVRIFAPNDDEYPAIGIQPFEGEIYQPTSGLDW